MLGNVTHDNYLLPGTLRHTYPTNRGMGVLLLGTQGGWGTPVTYSLRYKPNASFSKPTILGEHVEGAHLWDKIVDMRKKFDDAAGPYPDDDDPRTGHNPHDGGIPL